MSILDELRKSKKVRIRCPRCDEDFPASEAALFDATRPLLGQAKDHADALRKGIKATKEQLDRLVVSVARQSEATATGSNLGVVIEKLAPSLPGFPADPSDFRALLQPIDYVAFNGLHARGAVDSILFAEMKSSAVRLDAKQQQVRNAVLSGKVSLVVLDDAEEGE